jgi:hypothetical protein
MVWLQERTTQEECAFHLIENRIGRHHKSRKEEFVYGG